MTPATLPSLRAAQPVTDRRPSVEVLPSWHDLVLDYLEAEGDMERERHHAGTLRRAVTGDERAIDALVEAHLQRTEAA